jgi:hypothetical protein
MKMKAPIRKDRIHSPPGYSAIKPLNKYTSAKSPARVKISTKIMNYGEQIERFNLTVYANGNAINRTEVALGSGESVTVNLTWAICCLPRGANYTISASVDALLGEADLTDNNLTDGWVVITKVGDLGGGVPPQFYNWDDKVDGKDLALFLMLYKGYQPPPYTP